MDENKIPENSGELKGFDEEIKAEPLNPQTNDEFFDGYTVTKDGGFFESKPFNEQDSVEEEIPSLEEEPIKNDFMPSGNYGIEYETPKNKYDESSAYFVPLKKESAPKQYSLGVLIIAIVLAAVIGAASSLAVFSSLGQKGQTEDNDKVIINGGNEDITINVSDVDATIVEAVAKKVTNSVVGIRVTVSIESFFGGTQESSGEGSGVIYTSDGYIITNYHVIEASMTYADADVRVFLNDAKEDGYQATVVGYNISNDLAVIKINAENLPAVTFADSDKLNPGQFVVAIGNPGGLEFMGSVTYGVISGLNRVISDTSGAASLIQTDAAINPGNSGGALVNINGELVGVNSSKIVANGYEGMGFAIPSNTVKEITDKIISNKDDPTPYIGVTISERYDAETLKAYGFPVGAVVNSVVNGGPADNAGIERADIITEFNGVEITDYTILNDEIAKCKPGQTVSVTIYRARRYYTTNIKIGSNNEVS